MVNDFFLLIKVSGGSKLISSFRSVVYKEKIPEIRQLELVQGGDRCMVGSTPSSMTARVSIKMFPEGDTLVTVEYPFKKFVPAVLIQVNSNLPCIICNVKIWLQGSK